ncbi:GNAT family N-acetyltransferase [Jannaschia donghaensis]|uniref:Putative acetyltransferase n=1 Tax=Jannaschia donghaensis TaxID=420998 RepID=A0A0M6YJ27_9RHOB|nr:GNAT family N-acetyltransferase [Jannaschia donghaensis]CTQ49789.1 putative acetyltransferase [Jannaschia donghaensis]
MIPLDASHLPQVEALLAPDRANAMFILSNLRTHGFGGDHPHGMQLGADAPTPTALLGLTNGGMVLPYLPDPDHGPAAATLLRGQALGGVAGPAAMVRPLLDALDLAAAPTILDADEPQFLLDLAAMNIPDGPGTLAPLSIAPDTAADWRAAYDGELHLGEPSPDAARADVDDCIAADSHRFVMIDGIPAAMTGFNATLPDIVQVGGVYTPPGTRGRGLARRAVALHLAEARATGVRQATLFAASDAAVACYRPLGFERIGTFALVLFDGKVTP